MKIVIFSPTSTMLYPKAYETRPLGGADTTLLKMIEILSEHHEVKAYIPIKEQTENYYPFMDIFQDEGEYDLLIHYRKMWALPTKLKYKKAIFYSQDTADTPCFAGVKSDPFKPYSKIIVLSNFHKKNISEFFNIEDDKFIILGNAAPFIYVFDTKRELEFIYASTPFRGLVVLMKMWKKIIERYPNAKLHVFSSMKIYDAEALDEMQFNKIYRDLENMKGVIYHGSKPQHEVIEVMKNCKLLLYPNTYPETYCNVLQEAINCATPFITTKLGSLPEVGGEAGFFIEGSAYSKEYQDNFLKLLFEVLDNDAVYFDLQNATGKYCRDYDTYEFDLLRLIKNV